MPTIDQLPGVIQAMSLADLIPLSQTATGGASPGSKYAVQAPLSVLQALFGLNFLSKAGDTMTGALQFATPRAWSGTSLFTNPLISQQVTFTGTNSGSLWSGANDYQITDNMNVGTGGGNGFNGFSVRVYPGTSAKIGNDTAINGAIVMGSTTGNTIASGHSAAYGPLQGYFISSVNDNGTSGTPWGGCFGLNTVTQLLSGATFWGGLQGAEFDVGVNSGASVDQKIGVNIVLLAGDAVQGATDDVALTFNNQYAQGSGAGWKTLIGIGRNHGGFPASTTGTLLTGMGPGSAPYGTMAHGLKLRNITWGVDWLDGPGLTITGAGVSTFDTGIVLGGTVSSGGQVVISTLAGASIDIIPQGTGFVSIQASSLLLTNSNGSGPLPIFNFGSQILAGRQTGWGAPTGTLSRATFATGSVTAVVVAETLAALIVDLQTHGLIGP